METTKQIRTKAVEELDYELRIAHQQRVNLALTIRKYAGADSERHAYDFEKLSRHVEILEFARKMILKASAFQIKEGYSQLYGMELEIVDEAEPEGANMGNTDTC